MSLNFRIPYLALAKTLMEIEEISSRLKIVEILSNYFRSCYVLTPEDLLPSVYLCLNKLGPAYEGKYFIYSIVFSNQCAYLDATALKFTMAILNGHFIPNVTS